MGLPDKGTFCVVCEQRIDNKSIRASLGMESKVLGLEFKNGFKCWDCIEASRKK
jgi:hypothetical protein